MTLNETHRADLRSWVESAHDVGTDFPVQNLPLGVFRPRGADEAWRVGTSIGDQVVDLAAAARSGLLVGAASRAARDAQPGRSTLMELEPCTGRPAGAVSRLLRVRPRAAGRRLASRSTAGTTWNSACLWPSATTPISAAAPAHRVGHVPARNPCCRTTSGCRSGTTAAPRPQCPPASILRGGRRRPNSRTTGLRADSAAGLWVAGFSRRRALGEAVPWPTRALLVLCLLNDWSAGMCRRGSTSLGVHGQSFAATLSPWVVTMDALASEVQTAARGEAIRAAAHLTDRANAGAAVSPCWSGVYLGRRA